MQPNLYYNKTSQQTSTTVKKVPSLHAMTKQKVKTELLTTAMKTTGEQGLTMKETLKCRQEGITKTIPSLRDRWGLGQAMANSNKETAILQPTLRLSPLHTITQTPSCV